MHEAGDRSETHAFIRKSRLKCHAVAASLEEHEEFKRRIKTQTLLRSAETAAILFWALMASGQIAMRKVDGWRSPAERPSDQAIDLAASSSNLVPTEIAPNTLPRLHLPPENARLNDKTEAVHRINRKNAADDSAIRLVEDLPVAAVLGKVR